MTPDSRLSAGEELSFPLEYSVDVLGETEQIQGEDSAGPAALRRHCHQGQKKGTAASQIWREWTR